MNALVNAGLGRLPLRVAKSLSGLQWRSTWLRKAYLAAANSYTGRDGVVQRGPGKGMRFNPGMARNAGFVIGTYEREVQNLYAALIEPGMVVYDVGANLGFLSVLAARLVGPLGRVVCFAPLPSNADAIEYNAKPNALENITSFKQALGSRDGIDEFLVSAEVEWSPCPLC